MKKSVFIFLLALTPFIAHAYDDYDDYYEVSLDGLYYRLYPSTNVAEVLGIGYEEYYEYDETDEYHGFYDDDDEYDEFAIAIPSEVYYDGNLYSVTSISDYAFEFCESLTHIYIPSSVYEIGYGAFAGCSDLISIIVDEDNPTFDSRDDCNAIIKTSTNTLIAGCNNTLIPEGVTAISSGAFIYCYGLTSLTIPSSVRSIGEMAFIGCPELSSLIVDKGNSTFDSRDDCNAIIETSSNTLLIGCMNSIIPNSVTGIGSYAFYECTNLSSIDIPNGVTGIGSYAFYECTNLSSIDIPHSVNNIGESAFEYCYSLTSIEVPSGVTEIADGVFSGCVSLSSFYLPDGVTSIGSYAFDDCYSLSHINIPSSVTYIGYGAFAYCSSLTSIEIPNGVSEILEDAFMGCSSLISVNLPDGLLSIGGYAFYGCTSLSSIDIPNTVTMIEYCAFTNCSSLCSIFIHDDVFYLGEALLAGCSSLTSIIVGAGNATYDSRNNCNAIIETSTNTLIAGCNKTIIPSNVTRIGDYAFSRCSSLSSIDIPQSVTSIGYDAFYYCTGLTSILIPKSVTAIRPYAFYGCRSLTTVISEIVDVYDIDSDVFDWDIYENAILSVPSGTLELYQQAEGWCYFQNIIDYSIEKMQLTDDLFTIYLPDEDITYDGLRHGASIDVKAGVGKATFYYLKQGETSLSTEPPSEVGEYTIYLEIADGLLYYGRDRWMVGSFTIYQFSQEEWQKLQEIHSELLQMGWSDPWNMSQGVRSVAYLDGLDIEKGHVVGLHLAYQELTGGFPISIFALPHIKSISLEGNHLDGDISEVADILSKQDYASRNNIEELDISWNLFSGNLGPFANCFVNLKTLYAPGNCLEDVSPMISETVADLDIRRQTISRVVPIHLANLSADTILKIMPSIILYDHTNRTYNTNITLDCYTSYDNWRITMSFLDDQLTFPYVSALDYYGESGDIIKAYDYNGNWSKGSSFYICLNYDSGDCDFDGNVNVLDLQSMINRMFERRSSYRPFNFTAANLWEDAVINVQDAVCLVNVLLDMDSSAGQASRRARQANDINSEYGASVSIEDDQLVINSSVPVSAFDIVVSSGQQCEVLAKLAQMGFTCSTRQDGDRLHLVGYSLGGTTLPAGKNVICRLEEGVILYAMLADEDAQEIMVTSTGAVTDIRSGGFIDPTKEVYRIPVGSDRVIVINSNREKSMIKDDK